MSDLFKVTDRTTEFDAQDIEQNRAMGILAYISWLVLVPIFAAKDSQFARFHANQGLALAICEAGIVIICGALGLIPFTRWIFSIIEYLVCTGCGVLAVFGIVFAAQGKCKELPIIGGIKILK